MKTQIMATPTPPNVQRPEPLPPAAGYAAKPPIGVIPKQLWMEKRARDLARAIHEYAAEGRYEPVGEWLTELHELWPHIDGTERPE